MSLTVILDADFLSAFLKIEQLPLVRDFYQVDRLYVPPAVFREIALTTLLPRLLALPWVVVKSPHPIQTQALVSNSAFARLGTGEQEAIALALDHPGSVLLTNDGQAMRLADSFGANVVNVPAFLLACKLTGLLDRPTMAQVVADLQAKDHYGFRPDVLALLMG